MLYSSSRSANKAVSSHPSPTAPTSPPRGRPLVLTSSAGVVTAFVFFYSRAPSMLVSWSISQKAFNSCMILLLDALETGSLEYLRKIEQAYVVFKELQDNGIHKLAGLAVEKLSWGLDQLRRGMGGIGVQRFPEGTELAGTSQDRTENIVGIIHDTVMGNSGMLLPEESGPQSHRTERFTPFDGVLGSLKSAAATPSQAKQDQEVQSDSGVDTLIDSKLQSPGDLVSMPGKSTVTAASPQDSAPKRYRAQPPQNYCQSQHRVANLAPPTSLAEHFLQHDCSDNAVSDLRLPRSEQSSRIQTQGSRRTTPPTTGWNERIPALSMDIRGGIQQPERWVQSTSTAKQHQIPSAQFRHNSCPSVDRLASTPPLLRTTYSSPLANKAQSPVEAELHLTHTHWSSNHATPALGSPEPGMLLSPMSDQGYTVLTDLQESSSQQQMMHLYSHCGSTDPTRMDVVPTGTVEQMTVDQWKRWVGSGALG